MGSSGLADAWDGSSLRKVLKSQYFCKVERRKVRDLDADRGGRLERNAGFSKKCRTVVVLRPRVRSTGSPDQAPGQGFGRVLLKNGCFASTGARFSDSLKNDLSQD